METLEMLYSSDNYTDPALTKKLKMGVSGLLRIDTIWSLETIFKNLNICEITNDISQAKIFSLNIQYLPIVSRTLNPSKFFNKEIISRLISGKSKLVINYLHEANHRYSFQIDDFNLLFSRLTSAGIPYENIIFLTGDVNAEKIFSKNVDRINIIGFDIFEYICARSWYKKSRLISNFSLDKPFDFLYLNGSPRVHRCFLKYFLDKNNLLKNSIYSWLHYHPVPSQKDIEYFLKENRIQDIEPKKIYQQSLITQNLDIENNDVSKLRAYQISVDPSWFENSMISLVTETHVKNDLLFITEKTYKPIAFGHPFIIFGNPQSLNLLKTRGYETFSCIFNENYDSIQDVHMRTEYIRISLQTFKEKALGKESIINEIIKYNRNLFFQIPSETNIKETFIKLLDSI